MTCAPHQTRSIAAARTGLAPALIGTAGTLSLALLLVLVLLITGGGAPM